MENPDRDDFCFPQLNNSCRKPSQPYAEAMLIYTLLSIVSLVTVALNLLVIISISHFRQLHTPTNLLLLSLAVSDLFVGFLLMPVEIFYIEACWLLGDVVCTLYYLIDYVVTSASVANMVLITVDRYVAICDPLRYPTKVTKRKVEFCVCLSWLCSIFYRIFLLIDHLRLPGKSVECLGECVVVISYVAGLVDFIFTFAIPITIITVLYTRVFVVALSHARAIRSHIAMLSTQQRSGTVKKTELKAAMTLGLVVVVFLICFCPYYYPIMVGEDTSVDASSAAVEIWLAHFNSCLNPVIYAIFYPWFRNCIKRIVTLQILNPGSRDTNIF